MCFAHYNTLLAAVPWAEEYLRDQRRIQEIENNLYQLQGGHKTSEEMHLFRNVTYFKASKCQWSQVQMKREKLLFLKESMTSANLTYLITKL